MTDAPAKPSDEALVEAMFNAYWNVMDKQGGNSDVLHIAIRAALAVARRELLSTVATLRAERDEYKRKADLWDHEDGTVMPRADGVVHFGTGKVIIIEHEDRKEPKP